MHVHKAHHIDHEIMKWLLTIVFVLALVLIATRTTAAEPVDANFATTVASRVEAAFLPKLELTRNTPNKTTNRPLEAFRWQQPTGRRLWEIFKLHEKKDLEAAIEGWQQLSLFDCDEPWRAVAVGLAYLQLGEFDNALCVLEESDVAEPNAVTYHLRGVVHWMNGRLATRAGKLYLADEYRDLARTNFEQAVTTSTHVKLNEKLGLVATKFVSHQVRPYHTLYPKELLPPSTPTVRDLLTALDLEDYAVKSNLGLAAIALQDGLLEKAEGHLDEVANSAADIAELYTLLGEAYENRSATVSAARVYMKAMAGERTP